MAPQIGYSLRQEAVSTKIFPKFLDYKQDRQAKYVRQNEFAAYWSFYEYSTWSIYIAFTRGRREA